MTTPQPHFETTQDVNAFVSGRVRRASRWYALFACISIIFMQWRGGNVLGVAATAFGPSLLSVLGDMVAAFVGVVLGIFVYAVLPTLPWALLTIRRSRKFSRRLPEGRCLCCEYDLGAVMGRRQNDTLTCPECGATYAMTLTPLSSRDDF